jgi:hypothetical protein
MMMDEIEQELENLHNLRRDLTPQETDRMYELRLARVQRNLARYEATPIANRPAPADLAQKDLEDEENAYTYKGSRGAGLTPEEDARCKDLVAELQRRVHAAPPAAAAPAAPAMPPPPAAPQAPAAPKDVDDMSLEEVEQEIRSNLRSGRMAKTPEEHDRRNALYERRFLLKLSYYDAIPLANRPAPADLADKDLEDESAHLAARRSRRHPLTPEEIARHDALVAEGANRIMRRVRGTAAPAAAPEGRPA